MDKHLHIVCLDVPWPADYGGVVDLFYKISSLHALGVKIHLHCFTKDRQPQEELNKYCSSVNYYQRRKNLGSFSLTVPLIVSSRINNDLLQNLRKDDHPILLEGIHCTYLLKTGKLDGRKVIVRLHNAEFEYYRQLAKHESSWFKKLYYLHESGLLSQYENALSDKATFLAVSEQDIKIYREKFNVKKIHYLPVFLPYHKASGENGKGTFSLYHGNLAINENEEAAVWLLENVFNKIDLPFVIAGKSPSKKLQQLSKAQLNTCLVADPSEAEMQDMIHKAHIHVLPSFNNTGIKLKLLNAVFNGRHCLVNKAAVEGSGLEPYCQLASDADAFISKLKELYELPFSVHQTALRQQLLETVYNNEANARRLITFLW